MSKYENKIISKRKIHLFPYEIFLSKLNRMILIMVFVLVNGSTNVFAAKFNITLSSNIRNYFDSFDHYSMLNFTNTTKGNMTSVNCSKCSNENNNINSIKVEWYILAFLSFLYGAISVISVIGNGLIVWAVMRSRRMKNVTNYFICNLALADIVIGLLVAPFQFQTAYLQRWIFPRILCKIAPFAATLSVNVSILTLVIISIDRYYVILYPFKIKLRMSQCYYILILIWMISFVLSVIKLFNFKADTNEAGVLVCSPLHVDLHKYDTLFLVIIQYIVPFFLISFTYFRIGFHIYFDETPNSVTNNQSRNKKKVIKMIFIVVILFMLCWAPIQVFNFLNVLYPESSFFTELEYKQIIVVWLVCNSLAMSNSCYNVFIYGACSVRFKREFRHVLGTCFICLRDESYLIYESSNMKSPFKYTNSYILNQLHSRLNNNNNQNQNNSLASTSLRKSLNNNHKQKNSVKKPQIVNFKEKVSLLNGNHQKNEIDENYVFNALENDNKNNENNTIDTL